MNHLLRSLAPISDSAWQMLDGEARDRLVPALAARKLVDFSGPHGWEHSATNLGRTMALPGAPCDGVTARQRRVLPLMVASPAAAQSLSVLHTFSGPNKADGAYPFSGLIADSAGNSASSIASRSSTTEVSRMPAWGIKAHARGSGPRLRRCQLEKRRHRSLLIVVRLQEARSC